MQSSAVNVQTKHFHKNKRTPNTTSFSFAQTNAMEPRVNAKRGKRERERAKNQTRKPQKSLNK